MIDQQITESHIIDTKECNRARRGSEVGWWSSTLAGYPTGSRLRLDDPILDRGPWWMTVSPTERRSGRGQVADALTAHDHRATLHFPDPTWPTTTPPQRAWTHCSTQYLTTDLLPGQHKVAVLIQ
jgi:hypothetical protein